MKLTIFTLSLLVGVPAFAMEEGNLPAARQQLEDDAKKKSAALNAALENDYVLAQSLQSVEMDVPERSIADSADHKRTAEEREQEKKRSCSVQGHKIEWYDVSNEVEKNPRNNAKVLQALTDLNIGAGVQRIVIDYLFAEPQFKLHSPIAYDYYPASSALAPRASVFYDGKNYQIAMNQLKRTVKLFDATTGAIKRVIMPDDGLRGIPRSFCPFHCDKSGWKVAISQPSSYRQINENQYQQMSGGNIGIFDVETGKRDTFIANTSLDFDEVENLQTYVDQENKRKIAGVFNKSVKIFDVATGTCERIFSPESTYEYSPVSDFQCVPEINILVMLTHKKADPTFGSGKRSNELSVEIWDMNSGKCITMLPAQYDSFTAFEDTDKKYRIAALTGKEAHGVEIHVFDMDGECKYQLRVGTPDELILDNDITSPSKIHTRALRSYQDNQGNPHLLLMRGFFKLPYHRGTFPKKFYSMRDFDLNNKTYYDTPLTQDSPYCGISIGQGDKYPLVAIPTVGDKLQIWSSDPEYGNRVQNTQNSVCIVQ